jgi:integrase
VENINHQADAPRAAIGESLEMLIQKYAAEQKKSGAWRTKTELEVQSSLGLLVEFLGNLPVHSIDHAMMRSYKEALMRLPANIRKSPAYRDKSIDEILQLNVDQTMSTTTINKQLDRASALFRWAVRNDYMVKNPAEALQLSDSRRPDEVRDPFDDEDLKKIFYSRSYVEDKHRHSYCYWVPILALFTGMRLNEICQLHLSDIYKAEDGTYVIHVNEENEKGLKNKSSIRIVPIHDFLLQELNLPAYVERLRSEGQTRLFPELRQHRDSYGQTVTKWFGRYRERCGIVAEKYRKTFHSFRHTVAKRLREANVPDSQIAQLIGHEEGSETSRYGKRQSPRLLKERAVDQLSYSFDLSHLKKSRLVVRSKDRSDQHCDGR